MNDRKYCVYAHKIDGVIRYIGEGTETRAYRKSRSNHINWHNTFHNKEYEVVILESNLTKIEAAAAEIRYIEENLDTIINKKKTKLTPINIDYDEVSSVLYYDETSPTFLRWKNNIGKFKAHDVAGYISKVSKYADVTVNDTLYRVHRIVWVLFNKSIPVNAVIDHISGNRSDNRISNLRLATAAENNKNKLIEPSSIGLRNIRKTVGKSGFSSFEVVWVDGGKRSQRTFNVNKIGSIEKALIAAYKFRDALIESGTFTHRLKDGEKQLEEVIKDLRDEIVTSKSVRTLPKSGLRMIDFNFYKGKFYRFVVRYNSASGKVTSKTFTITTGIESALASAYAFRESLIQTGVISERVKENESSFEEVLKRIERCRNDSI